VLPTGSKSERVFDVAHESAKADAYSPRPRSFETMNEISELRQTLERYDDELAKLRNEVPPDERLANPRLQEVRAARQATVERLRGLRAETREWSYKQEPERADYADYFRAVETGEREADHELAQRLRAAVLEVAPTSSDDPRLWGWYHTIDVGNGVRSTGRFDLRAAVDLHGLPDSLEGKSALDVGTCDGFWAFELERREADRVVGIDIERMEDFDWLPSVRKSLGRVVQKRLDHHFWLAHAMRGSAVEHKVGSVYDLSPDTVGETFDIVFCGSLLLHLQSPLKALINIRSVTREMAVIATSLSDEAESRAPEQPWLSFGNRAADLNDRANPRLGSACVYWQVNTRGLQEVMEYAGFGRTEALKPVRLTPTEEMCAVVVGYPI
jgi:tRNA (mo5U34)-methyltransferase